MIGTGTGVAPFIGMIQEKDFFKEKSRFGELALIFGCRNSQQDFIEKDFFYDMKNKGVLPHLLIAFSQESSNPKESKHYVQDVLQVNSETLKKVWIENDGVVYICGFFKKKYENVSVCY